MTDQTPAVPAPPEKLDHTVWAWMVEPANEGRPYLLMVLSPGNDLHQTPTMRPLLFASEDHAHQVRSVALEATQQLQQPIALVEFQVHSILDRVAP